VVVATYPAGKKKSPVGVTCAGVVYELFFTNLPEPAFTASDVVELYLHRGAFEPQFSDEDQEQDPDRWCSHSAWGQEAWGIVSQPCPFRDECRTCAWNWRISEFAPATEQAATRLGSPSPAFGYGPPTTATSWKTGRISGQDFALQPDGMLRFPVGQKLSLHERRRAH